MTGPPAPPARAIGPARLTAGFAEFGRLDLAAHLRTHGALDPLSGPELVGLADEIALAGRGGAGFPFARKVWAVAQAAAGCGRRPVVVVNAAEGEPGSWKDKVLLAQGPHLVLDGAALAAAALGAREIVLGVADAAAGRSAAAALAERRLPVRTRVVAVPERFGSGEGGALVRGIDGAGFVPPGRKVRASDQGVGGAPTLLSNVETYAHLALAARAGPAGYAAVGSADEPGTVLLTVTGSARRPAVVECPTGTPLAQVLRCCAAELGPAVLTGGFHGRWLAAAAVDRALVSRRGLAAVGGTLGAGVVLPLGDATCPLGEVSRVLTYLAGESAGQCGPCRSGLPELARRFRALVTGADGPDAVRAAAAGVRQRGACGHPDGTARFAASALEVFAADLAAHARHGGCARPVRGVLPLPPADAPESRMLTIDWSRCDGHGLCAHVAPELVELDTHGYPVLADGAVPARWVAAARRAVRMCPALALRLTAPATAAPGPARRRAGRRRSPGAG